MSLNIKKIFLYVLIIIYLNSFNILQSKEVPIIVIAPSKKAQSISTVGTSVTVLDEEYIENSNEYFLGDLLS